MSEDEACRRIDLARLARRFPALFPLLASADITLSAALVLKPVLTSDNQLELLDAARGKSIQQTRELVAARFPSPDVPTSIRKLPGSKPASAPAPGAEPIAPLFAPAIATAASCTPARVDAPAPSAPAVLQQPVQLPSLPVPSPPKPPRDRIEPLAAERYKLQLTIDATLKSQLETARHLLRHAHPAGDFAPILSRALELLIADLLRHRFGVAKPPKAARPKKPTPQKDPASASSTSATSASPASASPPSPSASSPSAPASPPRFRSAHIAHSVRRAVVDRDGLACSWVDANGTRCNSQAWLELDHLHPRGKGGGSEEENIRVLCRAHNHLAAERAYGRAHIDRAKAKRRALERRAPG